MGDKTPPGLYKARMKIITDNAALSAFCKAAAKHPYMTIDTEFIRERTYFPQLCLVQVAYESDAAIIDPMAAGVDLAPLFALLQNPKIVKVFHAARQDIEIFYHLSGKMPEPIFDTQIAASVCGHGDAASYESLVNSIVGASVDKSSRYSDWAARPLAETQLSYALSDVTHLRVIYDKLKAQVEAAGRTAWIAEEFAQLTDTSLYDHNPQQSYKRIKAGSLRSRHLVVLRALAAWREELARSSDIPRGRIVKDEVLVELALVSPKSEAELSRIRNINAGLAKKHVKAILDCVEKALAIPQSDWPQVNKGRKHPEGTATVVSMLQLLLKVQADKHNIAASMIANKDDLESLALGAESPLTSGWRYDVFGKSAEALMSGKLKISLNPKNKSVVLEETA
jgi:ribonuclease D